MHVLLEDTKIKIGRRGAFVSFQLPKIVVTRVTSGRANLDRSMNDYELLFSLDDDDACEFCNEITDSACYLAQTKDVLLIRD